MKEICIEEKDLYKYYDEVKAVNRINFEVEKREKIWAVGSQWCWKIDNDRNFNWFTIH